MKKILYLLFIGFAILESCSKKKDDTSDSSGLSQDIQNFVPQTLIDSMQTWGLVINKGKTPPMIDGVYNDSANLCTFDNSSYNYTGDYFANYHYKFHDQDNSKLTIELDYNDIYAGGSDSASGAGSFISGTGNDFTVFTDVKGVTNGVNYEAITMYSGTITNSGIKNLQYSFYMKDKGDDPDKKLIDVGSARIFKDEDGFSEKLSNNDFRSAVLKGNNPKRLGLSAGKALPER
ncbi:MAG TPA: hypothetical protein VFI29_15575 [Hanamia sp.]|nr:hypothetical protein [Hanamia sp.]